ncbi:hypothetical protein AB0L40_04950 [Patulibacter sp. NPDC049589]|uniref:hypothetical protein n=1 Tax=Patulibacter sp. NPDC049589 TaxID=3154731 RepID=UPI0034355542
MRARGGQETWTSISDVGTKFGGIELTRDEYIRVEDLYIAAVMLFARTAGASDFVLTYVGDTSSAFDLTTSQVVSAADVPSLIRGALREEVDCALESAEREFQIEFGFDLYIHFAAADPCVRAVEEVEAGELFLERGVPLVLWED